MKLKLANQHIIPDNSIIALYMDTIDPSHNNLLDHSVMSNAEKKQLSEIFQFFLKHTSTIFR